MKKTRKTRKKHITRTDTHIMLRRGLFIYALIVFVTFIFLSLSTYALVNAVKSQQNHARVDRIHEIYNSLNLDKSYRLASENIFGDKRVYDWDKSRTFASSQEYGRDATVDETFADLEKRATDAGFESVGTEYENSTAEQHHYKSEAGEYIRISVMNRAWHDSLLYGTQLPDSDELNRRDLAPVYVTIKVNLDDNNE